MFDGDDDFLDEENSGGDESTKQSGSALRKFGREQKKRADELEQQLRDIQAQLAKREASDVFAELGVSERVRKYYTGEPTKEAITAWWKEAAADFGVDPGTGDPTQTPEQQQQHADLSGVQKAAQAGSEKPDALGREAYAEIRKELMSSKKSSIDDLDAALARMGVPTVPVVAPQT